MHAPLRRLQLANAPPIIPRLSWGADESIRKAAPQYAPTLQAAFVHHTAGTNNYTPDQSAAIVRGIELYHVQGNGWNDIGYNFLVDKYGQVFEGRYGGIDKNVIGAHTEGFNTATVGVSLIGQYDTAQISTAAAKALEQLLAWRLDLAHVDPLGMLTYSSNGNPRFPAGTPVDLRAISGHRDAYFTDCPGNALYAQLPAIAKATALLGGPKIYAPAVAKTDETHTRFTARLSAAQPWTVTITNSAGTQVAQGTGTGAAVDWTWDASAAPPDKYTWTIAAGTARTATGTIGATTALTLQSVLASPQLIAPGETTTISYTLTAAATVTAALLGPTGQTLATLLTTQKPAGAQTLAFTPPPGLYNGEYVVALTATSGATAVTANASFTIDDILASFTATPGSATLELRRVPQAVALRAGLQSPPVALATGAQTVTWPSLPKGATYTVALTITDEFGTFTRKRDARPAAAGDPGRLVHQPALPRLRGGDARPHGCGDEVPACRSEGYDDAVLVEDEARRVHADRDRCRRKHRDDPLPPVAAVPLVVGALELSEDLFEQRVAVVLAARLEAQRRRRLHGVARQLVLGVVDVDADAEDDTALRRLRKDPRHLLAVEEDVVRRPHLTAEDARDRAAGDERELGPDRHRCARPQEQREEKRLARHVLPRPAEASAPCRLVIGDDERAFRVVLREQSLRRLALVDMGAGRSETHPD